MRSESALDEPGLTGRGKVQDRVLSKLQYGLMSGIFVPGQVFSLRKLAATLGTSPMPVRESLSRLVASNALEELPNRSVRVPRLDATSLAELFEVRLHIEGMAARIASANVTDPWIDDLAAINERGRTAHETGNMAEVLRANQEFHFAIYRLTRSKILLPIIEGLWLRCGPTMYFSLGSPGLWDTSFHIEIMKAFRQADPQAAEAAMRRDIAKTGDFLVAQARSAATSGPLADLLSVQSEPWTE
ncbi:GntR family transcriptional regulator [Faunimonas sp. B44]|uniref:GntR family transcriptional regulator n=1 Tax=Faunimonas sp. B44 TaxID=3461493 RepID=UPI00404509AF